MTTGGVTLSDGTKVTVDVSKLTVGEWRTFLRGSAKQEDAVINKCTGIEVVSDLLKVDFDEVVKEIVRLVVKPNEPKAEEPKN